jgi:hypothetical protein
MLREERKIREQVPLPVEREEEESSRRCVKQRPTRGVEQRSLYDQCSNSRNGPQKCAALHKRTFNEEYKSSHLKEKAAGGVGCRNQKHTPKPTKQQSWVCELTCVSPRNACKHSLKDEVWEEHTLQGVTRLLAIN